MNVDLEYSTLISTMAILIFVALILKNAKGFLLYFQNIRMVLCLKRLKSLSFIDKKDKLLLKDGEYYEILFFLT